MYWTALIPSWRTAGAAWPPLRDNSRIDGWEYLRDRAGENGFFNIVIALYLWATAENFNNKDEWKLVVEDVAWVLSCLLSFFTGERVSKRALAETDGDSTPVAPKKVCFAFMYEIVLTLSP